MEASQAGLAGGGEGQGPQGDAPAPEQGGDFAALSSQLQQLSGSQEQLRDYLMSQPWQPQDGGEPEGEPEGEQFDLSFLDPADAQFDPDAVAQRLGGLIDQATDRRVQQAIAPVQQQIQEERWNREAAALVDEFPDFGDPQKAEQIVGAAQQIAQAYGQPDLGSEPWFWRLAYMAQQTAESANQETADTPSAAHLEGGGGARPGGQQVDLGEAIIGARAGRSVLPFG